MKKTSKFARLIPYDVIAKAVASDAEALNYVVKHYEGYIAKMSTDDWLDKNGRPYGYVDEELRRIVEIKLITAILTFKPI